MKDLIAVSKSKIGREVVQAVDARELHKFLESKQDFSNWITKRIRDYGFEEGQDFVSFNKKIERAIGGTKRKDYAISLDMAKELSMVERNAKGKQARQYFIKIEKAYLSGKQEWIKYREEGKIARLAETDTIKKFVEYAEKQGSKNAKMYYVNITKGVYKALFMLETGGQWKGLREYLSKLQLIHLATAENVAQKYIEEGMKLEMNYKDIYRYAINKVEEMGSILGKGHVTTSELTGINSNVQRIG